MEKRIKSIQKEIGENQGVLIFNELNSYYFSGFKYTDGAFLITKKGSYLITDPRYSEAAEKTVKHCKVVCDKGLVKDLIETLEKDDAREVLLETKGVFLSTAMKFKEILGKNNIELIYSEKVDELIYNLRKIKTEDEFNKIAKAQEITEKALEKTLKMVKPGVRECDIALTLEMEMRKLGAEGVSFDLITISGKKTSMPHGEPDEKVVENGDFLTMDIGALYKGYHSDMTRTFAIGYATDEMKEIYDTVLKAQVASLDIIKAGVSCRDCDEAARSVIRDAGYGDCFKHSTGHGVGLEIHEEPGLSPKSEDVLKTGMVVTVEPGIYIPEKFGVRIEDMVYVTEDGYINFTKYPKNLIVI